MPADCERKSGIVLNTRAPARNTPGHRQYRKFPFPESTEDRAGLHLTAPRGIPSPGRLRDFRQRTFCVYSNEQWPRFIMSLSVRHVESHRREGVRSCSAMLEGLSRPVILGSPCGTCPWLGIWGLPARHGMFRNGLQTRATAGLCRHREAACWENPRKPPRTMESGREQHRSSCNRACVISEGPGSRGDPRGQEAGRECAALGTLCSMDSLAIGMSA
jgi:hypothetical protein